MFALKGKFPLLKLNVATPGGDESLIINEFSRGRAIRGLEVKALHHKSESIKRTGERAENIRIKIKESVSEEKSENYCN